MTIKLYLIIAGVIAAISYIGYFTYQQRQIGAKAALEKVDKQNEKLETLARDGRSALHECDALNWVYDFSTGKCRATE